VGNFEAGERGHARSRSGLLYDNFRYEVRPAGAGDGGSGIEGGGLSGSKSRSTSGSNDTSKSRKRVALIERFAGSERVIGYLEGWRATALQELDRHFADKDGRERGFRLFLALKSLRTVDARRGPDLFEALRRMTLEETIFWVWQYHSYGERAIGAMKHIHMNLSADARKW